MFNFYLKFMQTLKTFTHLTFPLLKKVLPTKIFENLQLRDHFLEQNENLTFDYWFHCSSGEIEYIFPLLREIKNKSPQARILTTYFSISVATKVQKSPLIDLAVPMPWDTLTDWHNFLSHYNVKNLFIARTDLWPAMIFSAQQRNLPVTLFSLTWSESKSHNSWLMKTLFRDIFEQISYFSFVSDTDMRIFLNHYPSVSRQKTHVDGDSRCDQVEYRLARFNPNFRLPKTNKKVLILASIWPEDERVLFPVLSELCESFFVVIVPHEPTPEALQRASKALNYHHLNWTKWSKFKEDPDAKSPPLHSIVIDEVGHLVDLYTMGTAAFVGGSFRKQVHSVLEPLMAGNFVFVGPQIGNSREALEHLSTLIASPHGNPLYAVTQFHKSDELLQSLSLINQTNSVECQNFLKKIMYQRRGASARIYGILDSYIN